MNDFETVKQIKRFVKEKQTEITRLKQAMRYIEITDMAMSSLWIEFQTLRECVEELKQLITKNE